MMAYRPLDLSLILSQELFSSEFNGLNSGIPTPTTPTLTPTSLRNLEDDFFIQFPDDVGSHENEAGFVPPLLLPSTTAQTQQANGNLCLTMVDNKSWQGGNTVVSSEVPVSSAQNIDVPTSASIVQQTSQSSLIVPQLNQFSPRPETPPQQTKRNTGGRRPVREKGLTQEEEDRRKLRRERNKMAAARCRKRRMDRTHELERETEELEEKKKCYDTEIRSLSMQKEDLEFVLKSHLSHCCRHLRSNSPAISTSKPFLHQTNPERVTVGGLTISIKSEPSDGIPAASQNLVNSSKRVALECNGVRQRPQSLPIASTLPLNRNQKDLKLNGHSSNLISDLAGVPISTPSNGIHFNFDSLMEGGTGLTPVCGPLVPSCSSQQRTSFTPQITGDLSSPDSVNNKLVSL